MYRLGNVIYSKTMSRKMYAIWLGILFILLWPWASMIFGVGYNIVELIATLLFSTLLFTSPLVIIIVGPSWIYCTDVISYQVQRFETVLMKSFLVSGTPFATCFPRSVWNE